MFVLLILWLAILLMSSLPAMLKRNRFRGYTIPARVSYALLLANEIFMAVSDPAISFWPITIALVMTLILVGLLETGFRNRLQNRLSVRFLLVISTGFVLTLLSLLLVYFWDFS